MTVETAIPVEAPSREKTTADVLRHAARIIEERGWCRGELQDNQGAVCAMGAVHLAVAGKEYGAEILSSGWRLQGDAENAIKHYLGLSADDNVEDWNDKTPHTAAEVIAALRAAADAAEARS
jgi:hypothetical protein